MNVFMVIKKKKRVKIKFDELTLYIECHSYWSEPIPVVKESYRFVVLNVGKDK